MMKSQFELRYALRVLRSIGTPFSASLTALAENGDWAGILSRETSPRDYQDAYEYFQDARALALFKKSKWLPGGPSQADRTRAATEKWLKGEEQCFRTNRRLLSYMPGFISLAEDNRILDFIQDVRKMIVRFIGDRPPADVLGRFGPGATYADKGECTSVLHKMSSNPTLTSDAIWHLPDWVGNHWGSHIASEGRDLVFVPGNRFTTVPKTALVDRAIGVEPSINVFYQLAYGRALRSGLRRRTGWDLNTASDTHRQVARDASVNREYCTLDLSNASDTLSRLCVQLLLPDGWFEVLNDLRSPKTLIRLNGRDVWVRLEKFSSMGNGFTFELETIIFAAIACTLAQKAGHAGTLGVDVFVFGDDIIVPDSLAVELSAALRFFGFSLNEAKSFWGPVPFRESCGADYFNGRSVRPYFFKEPLNEPHQIIATLNGYRRDMDQLEELSMGSTDLGPWFGLLDSLPLPVRECRGPSALGDLVIHDTFEHWRIKIKHGIRYVQTWKPLRHRTVPYGLFHPSVVLASALYGTKPATSAVMRGGKVLRVEGVRPRDSVLSYGVSWVPYS